MRLTRLISERPHGAEGRDEEHLTGYYCRGEFEATALVERLYRYEETGLEPEEVPESQWIPINKKKPIYHSEGFLVTIKNPYNKRLDVENVGGVKMAIPFQKAQFLPGCCSQSHIIRSC